MKKSKKSDVCNKSMWKKIYLLLHEQVDEMNDIFLQQLEVISVLR